MVDLDPGAKIIQHNKLLYSAICCKPLWNVDVTFTYDSFSWKTFITYTKWPGSALLLSIQLLQLWPCEVHWLCSHVKYMSWNEKYKPCLMPCECYSAKHNLLHFHYWNADTDSDTILKKRSAQYFAKKNTVRSKQELLLPFFLIKHMQ